MVKISSQVGASYARPPARPDQTILTSAKGGAINFVGTLFGYAGQFALGLLLARFMGAEQYGLYSLADTALSLATGLALLGLGEAVVRYVSIFADRRDEGGLWGTLQIGLGIPFIIGVLAGMFLFVFADSFARLAFQEPRLAPLLRIVAFTIPFSTLMYSAASATQGFKQMQHKVIAQDISMAVIKLILVAAVIVFIGLNAVRAMTVYAIAVIAASVMLLYFLHRLFPVNRPFRAARLNTKQMLVFSLPLYFSRLIAMFGSNLQTVLLGVLNTVTSVGVFTAASRVSTIGTLFHSSIVVSAMPVVSELYSRGEKEQLGHVYQTMTKWTFTFNLPMFLIIIMFSKPILSIFGDSFVAGSFALTILAFGSLVNAGTGICGVLITMTGYTWLRTINSLLVLALTLTLNLLLIPRMGIVGAAIAGAGATALSNLARLLQVFLLFRLLPYNRSFIKPVLAGLAALAVTLVATRWVFTGTSLIYAAVNVTFLLVTYVAMILLLGLSEDDQIVLERLQRRLRAFL
jgi:O-antigen/teichoic acid export membrane protein